MVKINALAKLNKRVATPKKAKVEGDFWITILVVGLSLFGLVMVYSASYYKGLSTFGDPEHFLKDSIEFNVLGFAVYFVMSRLDYRFIKLGTYPALIVGVILLCLIKTSLGVNFNGATRWLDIGGFTLMPGEIVKTCLIIFFAGFLAKDPDRIKRPIPLLGMAGVMVVCLGLIMLQPNISTAGLVLLIVAGMLFVAGLSNTLTSIGAALVGSVFALLVFTPAEYFPKKLLYAKNRITNVFNPFADALGSGYQVVQSLLALGSGGVSGVGLGKSVQKTLYLPESQNDFIWPIIGEELGFIGLLILTGVYVFLIYRCYKVCINIKDYYGMMLGTGITLHLALQVILHIAVCTASFFPTGVILPFISQGGNATLLFLFEMGIMSNLSKHANKNIMETRLEEE